MWILRFVATNGATNSGYRRPLGLARPPTFIGLYVVKAAAHKTRAFSHRDTLTRHLASVVYTAKHRPS